MILKSFLGVFLFLTITFASYTEGQRFYLLGKYEDAGDEFLKAYEAKKGSADAKNYLYMASMAYFFAGYKDSAYIQKARELQTRLFGVIEPEDPGYHQAVLARTYFLMNENKHEEAKLVYEMGKWYENPTTREKSKLICVDLYTALKLEEKAKKCQDHLTQSKSLEAQYAGLASYTPDADLEVVKTINAVAKTDAMFKPGDFTVQLGAFSSRENANNAKQRYESLGPRVVEKDRDGETLFLIQVGSFLDKAEAQKYVEINQKVISGSYQIIKQ